MTMPVAPKSSGFRGVPGSISSRDFREGMGLPPDRAEAGGVSGPPWARRLVVGMGVAVVAIRVRRRSRPCEERDDRIGELFMGWAGRAAPVGPCGVERAPRG